RRERVPLPANLDRATVVGGRIAPDVLGAHERPPGAGDADEPRHRTADDREGEVLLHLLVDVGAEAVDEESKLELVLAEGLRARAVEDDRDRLARREEAVGHADEDGL